MRDVFTMVPARGQSPRAGSPTIHARHLGGVVAGGLWHCMGITVAGEVVHPATMAIFWSTHDSESQTENLYSATAGIGNPVVASSKTGRDGIMPDHGIGRVSEDSAYPTGKSAIRSPKAAFGSLPRAMATDCIIAIQDMGAAGWPVPLSKWRIRAVSA